MVEEAGVELKARIDTGAGLSSIDAEILQIEKAPDSGKERVVFNVRSRGRKTKTIEKDVVEWASIKRKGVKEYDRRPVVTLHLCVGGKRIQGRVNLADRNRFLYPVLVGRNLLRTGGFLIDPRALYTHTPKCPKKRRSPEPGADARFQENQTAPGEVGGAACAGSNEPACS